MSSIIGSAAGGLLTNVALLGGGVVLAGATAFGVVQSQESAGTAPITDPTSYGATTGQ